jgi:predicted  nucleic acid-binding Zn-ribbon protein
VSAVAQLAGTVQEMEMMRAECSNLNSKVGMLQAEIDTLRDSSAAENKRLDDLVASGETERALLKERVTQAVSKLRQSVNVERHQWIEEKKRLMEQLERARGKDRRLHHASTVVEREQEKQEQGEVDLGTTTVADVVED